MQTIPEFRGRRRARAGRRGCPLRGCLKRYKLLGHPIIFCSGNTLRDYFAVPIYEKHREARLKVPIAARLPCDGKRAGDCLVGLRTVETDEVCLLRRVARVFRCGGLWHTKLPPRSPGSGRQHNKQYGNSFSHPFSLASLADVCYRATQTVPQTTGEHLCHTGLHRGL